MQEEVLDEMPAPAPAPPGKREEPHAPVESTPSPGVGVDPGAGPAAREDGEEAAPRYVIESIVVRGNRRSKEKLILRELGLAKGDVVAPDDRRVQVARLRLLSLGFFLDVHLSLRKGVRRGGAVLAVDVEERGTVVIKGLFLGTSEATALWGGVDLAETNFLGRGIMVAGGFVQSTRPEVPGARAGLGLRAQAAGPMVRPAGLAPTAEFLFSSGSEFFRAFGAASNSDPSRYVAVNTRRVGGTAGLAADLSRSARLSVRGRFETLHAELPGVRVQDLGAGRIRPIDFSIREGDSQLSALSVELDLDTRSDPVLPQTGRRVLLSFETGMTLLGSEYAFSKGSLQFSQYFRVAGNHALSLHGLAGAMFGGAPYFDQFFIGDLNALLPSRALGLNFSTLASRNFLDTRVAEQRFGAYAGRVMVEYAIPIWRRRGFVYRGDAFAAFGVLGLARQDDLAFRDVGWRRALPIDLTADLGIRLDTLIGIFNISVANALGRVPL